MQRPVILFDGECNLCNASVSFIIRRDPHAQFTFAALQSPIGQRLVGEHCMLVPNIETIVLVLDERCYTKSDAALRIARHLTGLWPYLALLLVIPRPIRDWGYDLVARNRYRWFGRRDSCMVPTPELRARFREQ